MIRYFKELEEPNEFYLDLINTGIKSNHGIDLEVLPLSFFE